MFHLALAVGPLILVVSGVFFHLSSRKLDLRINLPMVVCWGQGIALSVCRGLGSEVSDSSRIPSSASFFKTFSWVPWDDMMRSMRIHDDVSSST